MLLRTTLIPNSSAQEHRLLRSTFNIAYSANHSSCHSCLRRSCTLSGAVRRTVRFRMEKASTTTFCSQFDPQTSTWFDRSAEDSSRTVSYLVRRLRSALRSSSSLQLYVSSSSLIQQLLNINRHFASVSSSTMPNFLDQLYEVLLRRTPLNTRPRRFARLHDLSTMSNSIDQLSVNNVELHRPTVRQQCRTPSTADVMYAKSSNIELHLQSKSSQQCRTPLTIQADPSCVQC